MNKSTIRLWLLFGSMALAIVACAPAPVDEEGRERTDIAPPPLPDGAKTVEFPERVEAPPSAQTESDTESSGEGTSSQYWGIAPGEPLPILWEDLMPIGALEELDRQYAEFYAMLEKRYAANATSLADAESLDSIAEGSELDFMPQLGTFDVVEELDGQLVRIPGYVVPFDFDTEKRHTEFLFVPYMGACIHTPPPPPNQIIFVEATPAVRVDDIWQPYWLQGELRTQSNENDMGDAAYTLTLESLEDYIER